MLKKLLAGISAVALGLGLVALVAAPASAHTHSVSADCSAVSVDLTNYQSSDTETNTVTVTIDGTPVADTTFGTSFVQNYPFTTVAATHSYRVQVVAGDDSSYSVDTGVSTVSNCLPDDTTKPVKVCGWTGTPGSPYYPKSVSVAALLAALASGQYPNAIVPPFTYTQQGVAGSFAGQNWTTTGQVYFNSGCTSATVTPTTVTFTDAVCTATGEYGSGSGTISSVPAGIQYQASTVSADGPWENVGQGTVEISAGTTVWVRAIALDGYKLAGTSTWQHTVTHPVASSCVEAVAPIIHQSVCTTPGASSQASYTFTPVTGVIYQVLVGQTWVAASGTTVVTSFPTTVTGRAIAAPGYTLVGDAGPKTVDFVSPGDCIIIVTPTPPVFTDPVCTGPGTSNTGTLVLPDLVTATGETYGYYEVSVNGGAWEHKAPGTYIGSGTETTVEVRVIAKPGFTLTGTTTWSHTVVPAGVCDVDVSVVTQPNFTDPICDATSGELTDSTYTLTAATGIAYETSTNGVTFVATTAGTHTVPAGAHLFVRAIALPGFTLSGTTSWDHVYPVPSCGDLPTDPIVTPLATSAAIGCTTAGSYTLSNDLSDAAAVLWTVNGSTVSPGTYRVTSAQVVTVHAAPNAPAYGFTTGTQQDWTLTFTAPAGCELSTLALTGSSPTGGLLLAYFLLIAGLGIVGIRIVRRRTHA
jgi:hypothetical protein